MLEGRASSSLFSCSANIVLMIQYPVCFLWWVSFVAVHLEEEKDTQLLACCCPWFMTWSSMMSQSSCSLPEPVENTWCHLPSIHTTKTQINVHLVITCHFHFNCRFRAASYSRGSQPVGHKPLGMSQRITLPCQKWLDRQKKFILPSTFDRHCHHPQWWRKCEESRQHTSYKIYKCSQG